MRVAKKSSEQLILTVDDDQDNLTLVARTLEHEGYKVLRAGTGEEALEKMKTASPDLVLLDVNMPGMGGIEALKRIRANQSQAEETHTSVIIVSARSDTDDIVRGLDTGADDYVCKPFDPWELLARVRAQLRIKDLTDRLAEANERLQELVDIDDLTGLFNMRSVYQKLDLEIGRAKRYNRAVAVIMMDMDEFKDVNDSHDHLFGSFVLSEVGKIIRGNIRNVDFAARYGGDEFLIALSETTVEGAALFAERLRKVIGAYLFSKDGYSMNLTASIGVAVVQPTLQAIDAKTLVRYADHAMYDSKHSGKNCVRTFDMSSLSLRKTS